MPKDVRGSGISFGKRVKDVRESAIFFGKKVRDVKRCDGDGGEGAGGAFSVTTVPYLPSELAAADKNLSFGKRVKDVEGSVVSFGKMPKDVGAGGEREVEVKRNR